LEERRGNPPLQGPEFFFGKIQLCQNVGHSGRWRRVALAVGVHEGQLAGEAYVGHGKLPFWALMISCCPASQ
jgi:pyrroloquinoline quinone (PQQ) biosynthesis protein C